MSAANSDVTVMKTNHQTIFVREPGGTKQQQLFTPGDVDRVEFDMRFRGYDIGQVDDTLDALERTIERLSTTIEAVAKRNHDLETQLRMTTIDNHRLREKLKESQQ